MKRQFTGGRKLTRSKRARNINDFYRLHVEGFEVIKGVVPSDNVLDEIKEIGDDSYVIFNNKTGGGDNKRSQAFIGDDISPDLEDWVNATEEILETKYTELSATDMVVLKSLKGCKQQMAHCDYEQDLDFARCPDSQVPLGCLVCIMDGTTIDVWPRSIRLPVLNPDLTNNINPIYRTTIHLNVGDILVFRGDLVHAGSEYNKDNYRVHVYLDSTFVKRHPNRTWYMNNVNYIK